MVCVLTSRRSSGRTRSADSSEQRGDSVDATPNYVILLVIYRSRRLEQRRQLVGEEAQQQRDEVEVLPLLARNSDQQPDDGKSSLPDAAFFRAVERRLAQRADVPP